MRSDAGPDCAKNSRQILRFVAGWLIENLYFMVLFAILGFGMQLAI